MLVLMGCTTSAPLPKDLSQLTEPMDFSPKAGKDLARAEGDTLRVLTVSGGGHRAAHYALGMLFALDSIRVSKDSDENYLENIDIVSSVSGGSYGIATYLAAYVEDRECRGGKERKALELMKENRERLFLMGEGWRTDIIFSAINPEYWTVDKRNIDRLEENFHAELTKIEGCDKPVLISAGNLEGRGNLQLPFKHIVNATNSISGQIFPFYMEGLKPHQTETTSEGNAKTTGKVKAYFDEVDCMYLRGYPYPVHYHQIPYSLLLAASAAFPPVVTDGIYGVGGCDNKKYIRLTDGGQSDDNGIISALEYTKNWLGNIKHPNRKSAVIISLDALVETGTVYTNTKKDLGLLEVAIERNADLPRYEKKRTQREELHESNQREPTIWENYTSEKAILGAHVGFFRKPKEANEQSENISYLAFPVEEYGKESSDISTYDNSGGLSLAQRIRGVAEGIYQTAYKLIVVDSNHLKWLSEVAAYNLYCSSLESKKSRSSCKNYLKTSKALEPCFTEKKGVIHIVEDEVCHLKSLEKKSLKKSLLVFNHQYEKKIKNKLETMRNEEIDKTVQIIEAKSNADLSRYKNKLEKVLEQYSDARSEAIQSANILHIDAINSMIALTDLGAVHAKALLDEWDSTESDLEEIASFYAKYEPVILAAESVKNLSETFDSDDFSESSVDGVCEYQGDKYTVVFSLSEEIDCNEELLEFHQNEEKNWLRIFVDLFQSIINSLSRDHENTLIEEMKKNRIFLSKLDQKVKDAPNINQESFEENAPILNRIYQDIMEISVKVDEQCQKAFDVKKDLETLKARYKSITKFIAEEKDLTKAFVLLKDNPVDIAITSCNRVQEVRKFQENLVKHRADKIVKAIQKIGTHQKSVLSYFSSVSFSMNGFVFATSKDHGLNLNKLIASGIELKERLEDDVSRKAYIDKHVRSLLGNSSNAKQAQPLSFSYNIELGRLPKTPLSDVLNVKLARTDVCKAITGNNECLISNDLPNIKPGTPIYVKAEKTIPENEKPSYVSKNCNTQACVSIEKYLHSIKKLICTINNNCDGQVVNALIDIKESTLGWSYDLKRHAEVLKCFHTGRTDFKERILDLEKREKYSIHDHLDSNRYMHDVDRCLDKVNTIYKDQQNMRIATGFRN